MDAYEIVTGEELLPVGSGSVIRSQQRDWQKRAGKAQAQIYMGCSDYLLAYIKNIDDPAEMWEILQNRLNNTTIKIGRTQILRSFHASRPIKDEGIEKYFTRLLDYRNELIGTPEEITDETLNTHIFTTVPKEYEMSIKIFEHQTPAPSPLQVMDAIKRDEKKANLVKELGDATTGSALYTQRGGYKGRGRGRGRGRGNWRGYGNRGGETKDKDGNEYSCTHCKMNNHSTENCGILKRRGTYSGSGGFKKENDRSCFYCGKQGHVKTECHVRQRGRDAQNKVMKQKTGGNDKMVEANAALAQHGISAREDLF
jgi:hypothetical protein